MLYVPHIAPSCHCRCLLPCLFLIFTVYQPPIITGDTTVNEGGTLSLNCDSSNSNGLPPVQWFYQTNDVVSNAALLTLPDIMRSQAGNYTCQTLPPNPDNSRSSSVDVVVQCMLSLLSINA